MTFFDKHINLRLTEKTYKKVELMLKHNQDVFNNESHLIRCAINYFYKNFYKKELGEKQK